MSRKKALQSRASYYGDRNQGTPDHLKASRGYEAGYRAAMRDLRKIVRAVNAEVPDRPAPTLAKAVERVKQRHVHTSIMVRRWLRPLR